MLYMVRWWCLPNWHTTKISICIDYFPMHIALYIYHMYYIVYNGVLIRSWYTYLLIYKIQYSFWLLMIEYIIGFIWQMRKYIIILTYEILWKWICTCQKETYRIYPNNVKICLVVYLYFYALLCKYMYNIVNFAVIIPMLIVLTMLITFERFAVDDDGYGMIFQSVVFR